MIRARVRSFGLAAAACTIAVLGAASFPPAQAVSPIRYRFSIPEPEHHWMQVEATFPDLPPVPLELRISRSSPGRYALHEFAKDVYDVHVVDGARELRVTRPDESGWLVPEHGRSVTVRYRVYGDRVDGTYLSIDRTHLHMNMPAAIMWARGLDDRSAVLSFEPPAGVSWQVATQLHPGSTPREFTAPNLQYLMDSPVEFGPVTLREFTLGSRTFRYAAHYEGRDPDWTAYLADVQKIVGEEGAVFGEFPAYEPGAYTFLGEYLTWASGDGMEHRNSTAMSLAAGDLRDPGQRMAALDVLAHEFFHCWNVERIRPAGLEPFDFDRANLTDSLWLAEGFTQYYGPLALHRAGLLDLGSFTASHAALVDDLVNTPAHLVRSAVEMSRMAPFIDGGKPIDRTNWSTTVLSYYPYGAAVALAMDLSLRDRSDGRVSLDDFMRAMWRRFGRPGGKLEGYVDHPYTLADAEAVLAEVSGDAAFARDFFARYISGHDVADYPRLFARAGFIVRKRTPNAAWWGDVALDQRSGRVKIAQLVAPGTPAYAAGLEEDDEITEVDGARTASAEDVRRAIGRARPGQSLTIGYTERNGQARTATVTLVEDPHLEIVPAETAGSPLTAPQRAFRERWLSRHRP